MSAKTAIAPPATTTTAAITRSSVISPGPPSLLLLTDAGAPWLLFPVLLDGLGFELVLLADAVLLGLELVACTVADSGPAGLPSSGSGGTELPGTGCTGTTFGVGTGFCASRTFSWAPAPGAAVSGLPDGVGSGRCVSGLSGATVESVLECEGDGVAEMLGVPSFACAAVAAAVTARSPAKAQAKNLPVKVFTW